MAGVKWTENQLDAINARKGAVLVSAAAGSGKTAVLVERVIDMITDPVSPVDADRFLVVTYTRAAAGEMKERISARLDELLREDPFNENLRRQQMLLTKAQISTIHSFCSDVAREYFYTLDIPADFRIAEQEELEILKTNALNEVLERRYSQGDSTFENMAEMFSASKDDNTLQKIILMLYDFLRSHPFPKRWVEEKYAMYSGAKSVYQTAWGKAIYERTVIQTSFIKNVSERAVELLQEEPKLNNAKFGDTIRKDADSISILAEKVMSGDWNGIIDELRSTEFGEKISTPAGFGDNETKKTIMSLRDTIKDVMVDMRKIYTVSDEECINEITELAPTVRCLFDVMIEFGELYSELKKEKQLADFSDLEHWALKLLVKESENGIFMTETAKDISSRYDYVMVDEYQDANSIQDTIFKAVSDNDKKLFVVGDVKQSIYRFRQAMPEIFIGRKNRYSLYDRNNEQYPAKIILDKNFRSREGVTEAVNFVFKNLMSENVGDIEYNDEEKLVAGAEYKPSEDPCMSYHMLDITNSETQDQDKEEARYIAVLIRKIMSTQTVSTKQGNRKPQYGDFCILMRGVKKHAAIFIDELKNFGIPAVSETEDSFFARREIKIILSLLRVIYNPLQDIPLASVLLSPMFGFSEDDLTKMRVDNPKRNSLYSILLAERKEGEQKAKVSDFIEKLKTLRKAAASLPTDVLLDRIYTETSFPEIISAEEEGEYKRNNLRLLLQYAKNYENAGYRGVGGFVRFLDRLEDNGSDLACAENKNGNTENVVRIMTIHKSKGLEFPICIVANLTRKINTDTTKEVLLHNELGLGVKHTDKIKMCRYTTMPREAVSLEVKRNELSEELRVLYVAMTRAKEKLIMVSSVKNLLVGKKTSKSYLEKIAETLSYENNAISPYSVSSVTSLGDWITQCALIHPASHDLRRKSGYTGKFALGAEKPWEICLIDDLNEFYRKLISKTDTIEIAKSDQAVISSVDSDFEMQKERYAEMLKERLSSVYEYEQLSYVPMKVSASALAHKDAERKFAAISKPDFMNSEKLSGAQKGTAVHTFVQYCDIANARESVKDEIDRLVSGGYLTRVQGDSVEIDKAEKFVKSSVADRMLITPALEREYRFTVEIPASSVDSTLMFPYSEEQVILQGAIDCMFEENGRIVIVDYKTDRVKDPLKLAELYKEQLRLYKLAVEQITGKLVSQCLLYSFELGCEIEV